MIEFAEAVHLALEDAAQPGGRLAGENVYLGLETEMNDTGIAVDFGSVQFEAGENNYAYGTASATILIAGRVGRRSTTSHSANILAVGVRARQVLDYLLGNKTLISPTYAGGFLNKAGRLEIKSMNVIESREIQKGKYCVVEIPVSGGVIIRAGDMHII